MRGRFLLFALLLAALPPLRAGQLRVAAAASLARPAHAVARAFEAETGNELKITLGASGTLFAQIVSGAPFSVFLSADNAYPSRLEKRGLIAPGSRRVYARGRLALWVADRSDLPATDDLQLVLRAPELKRLAVADPRVAPYGAAAARLLDSLGVADLLAGRLVRGENVVQTAHLARSGAADAALLAASLQGIEELRRHGRWVPVPQDLSEPVEHSLAVVGGGGQLADQFVDWLLGPVGQRVLAAHGLEPAPRTVP